VITKSNIDDLYRKFRRKPRSEEARNLQLLEQCALDASDIEIDSRCIRFCNVDPGSPFATIELERIHGVVDFDRHVAIVLPSSIIFLDKEDHSVHIHIKEEEPRRPWWRRIFG
jgi:hypothetical protein